MYYKTKSQILTTVNGKSTETRNNVFKKNLKKFTTNVLLLNICIPHSNHQGCLDKYYLSNFVIFSFDKKKIIELKNHNTFFRARLF